MQEDIKDTVDAIKLMVIGCILAEYGCIKMVDESRQELKRRVNMTIGNSRQVQDWFRFHPMAGNKYDLIFKREFNKDEIVIIADILLLLFGFNEDSLEDLRNQLASFTKNEHIDFAPTEDEGAE